MMISIGGRCPLIPGTVNVSLVLALGDLMATTGRENGMASPDQAQELIITTSRQK